jgi:hypothetical protein
MSSPVRDESRRSPVRDESRRSPVILGVRECFNKLIRKVGLIILDTNKQHTYLLEVSIDNSVHIQHLDCSVLNEDAFDKVRDILEPGVEYLTTAEIKVYLRMILWIIANVSPQSNQSRRRNVDTIISYSYNQELVLPIKDLTLICQQILYALI